MTADSGFHKPSADLRLVGFVVAVPWVTRVAGTSPVRAATRIDEDNGRFEHAGC